MAKPNRSVRAKGVLSTLNPAAGAARQLMRSAASRGHSEKDMDDFTRDMGGRMVIKVFWRWNAFLCQPESCVLTPSGHGSCLPPCAYDWPICMYNFLAAELSIYRAG
jgi:hypothetical protein